MFGNPRRGRLAINFTTYVPKILDLILSSEQIFSENWRWVPLVLNEQLHILQLSEALGSALPLREAGKGFVGVLPLPSTHFWSSRKHYIVHGNNAQDCFRYSLAKSITGCIKFTKRTELWIDFWQLDDIFEPPGQNELIIWKTDSRFFFLSPHLPYVFGHVRLTGLLLRCSYPTLNQFWETKSDCFAA